MFQITKDLERYNVMERYNLYKNIYIENKQGIVKIQYCTFSSFKSC